MSLHSLTLALSRKTPVFTSSELFGLLLCHFIQMLNNFVTFKI